MRPLGIAALLGILACLGTLVIFWRWKEPEERTRVTDPPSEARQLSPPDSQPQKIPSSQTSDSIPEPVKPDTSPKLPAANKSAEPEKLMRSLLAMAKAKRGSQRGQLSLQELEAMTQFSTVILELIESLEFAGGLDDALGHPAVQAGLLAELVRFEVPDLVDGYRSASSEYRELPEDLTAEVEATLSLLEPLLSREHQLSPELSEAASFALDMGEVDGRMKPLFGTSLEARVKVFRSYYQQIGLGLTSPQLERAQPIWFRWIEEADRIPAQLSRRFGESAVEAVKEGGARSESALRQLELQLHYRLEYSELQLIYDSQFRDLLSEEQLDGLSPKRVVIWPPYASD